MMERWKRIEPYLLYGVLALYVVSLASLLFVRVASPVGGYSAIRPNFRSVNLVPFRQITEYLSGGMPKSVAFINLIGNVVVFIPLGVYLALFGKDKGIPINLLFVFLISVSVEALQYAFACGASDIDDVLLNCLGGMIGILIHKALLLLLKSRERTRTAVVLVSIIVGLPVAAVTIISAMR